MSGKRNTITLEQLRKLISDDIVDPANSGDWRHARNEFFSEGIDQVASYRPDPNGPIAPVYDLESHINWIKHWLIEYGCDVEKNLTITTYEDTNKHIKIKDVTKIALCDLDIIVKSSGGNTITIIEPPYQSKTKSRVAREHIIALEIKNCVFKKEDSEDDFNCYFQFTNVHGKANLHLINNIFDDIDLYMLWNPHFIIDGNAFANRHVTIARQIGYEKAHAYNVGNSAIFSDKTHSAAKDLMKFVNKDIYQKLNVIMEEKVKNNQATASDILEFLMLKHEMIDVRPHEVELEAVSETAILRNNEFNTLSIGGENFCLESGNKANYFSTGDSSISYFSPHQDLIRNKSHVFDNLKTFLKLKQNAEKNGDNIHAQVFKREIIRCEIKIMADQKFKNIWQDALVLWWGEVSSLHGISWARSLAGLGVVNIIASTTILLLNGDFAILNMAMTFMVLLNPLEYASITANTSGWCLFLVLIVLALQKILYFLFIYELIRTTRRYTK